jgi:hypothetical protein
MFCYPNLTPSQQAAQRLVDTFNADEAHWRSLERRRRSRRKLLKNLTKKQYETLDLREFVTTRPPDDCIGYARS